MTTFYNCGNRFAMRMKDMFEISDCTSRTSVISWKMEVERTKAIVVRIRTNTRVLASTT